MWNWSSQKRSEWQWADHWCSDEQSDQWMDGTASEVQCNRLQLSSNSSYRRLLLVLAEFLVILWRAKYSSNWSIETFRCIRSDHCSPKWSTDIVVNNNHYRDDKSCLIINGNDWYWTDEGKRNRLGAPTDWRNSLIFATDLSFNNTSRNKVN